MSIMSQKSAMQSGQITHRLAEFASTWSWADIPTEVRHEAKRSLVNFFAVALAACNDPTIAKAVGVLQRFRASEVATIIGRSERTDILNAAALNAMSANVFDFDDTHLPTIIHPTAPVAPALLALAQSQNMSGQEFLLAFILGVEIECRLGNSISPEHYRRGWHITSTCGVFGSAAAAGRVLGLTTKQMGWAFGSAASQACGLVETLGTMAKSMSVGNSARNGLLSALLAQQDFDGPDAPIEGVRGFLNVTGENPNFEGLVAGLGTSWEMMSNAYKPYPCGVVLNPVIEACLALQARADFDLTKIQSIEVTGHPLLRQRTDRPAVRTGRESQVSAQHAVAIALSTGRAGLEEFSDAAVQRSDVQALGRRLSFVDDASMSIDATRVIAKMEDGSSLQESIDFARGCLLRPLSDGALERKLRELCSYGASGCDPSPLIDAIWTLDRSADVGSILGFATKTDSQ
jgi:2-methylcitrate dehydratase PrpD